MLSLKAKVQTENLYKEMCVSTVPLLYMTKLIVLLHTHSSLKVNNLSPHGDSTVTNDLLWLEKVQPEPKGNATEKCLVICCFFFATVLWRNKHFRCDYWCCCFLDKCASCVAFHLQYAGSLGNALQYAGLVAVLQEDGSVVVDVLHLDEHGGRACSPTACWTVVCACKAKRQTRRQALTTGRKTTRKWSHAQVLLSSHNVFNFVLVAQFRIISASPFLTYFGTFCKHTSLTQWFPKQENLSSSCSFFSNGNNRCCATLWNHHKWGHCLLVYKKKKQNTKGGALKSRQQLNSETNTKADCGVRIKDDIVMQVKIWNYNAPIASTINVYAACVSLSRPTTVRTTPSLKPTLNLPSWLPPISTQHIHKLRIISIFLLK